MSGQTSRLSTLSPGSGQGESLHLVHGLCLLEFFDLGSTTEAMPPKTQKLKYQAEHRRGEKQNVKRTPRYQRQNRAILRLFHKYNQKH